MIYLVSKVENNFNILQRYFYWAYPHVDQYWYPVYI